MHGHVHKDAAGPAGVLDVEPGRVVLVAGLGAQDGGTPDEPVLDLAVCGAVGLVEAAGETAHHFEVWALFCCGDDFVALGS